MTVNYKPDDLPVAIDEIDPEVRELIIDQHLGRDHLIARIDDHVDFRLDTGSDRNITRRGLIDLYRALADDPASTTGWKKADLADAIGDAVGIDCQLGGGGNLRKAALINLYVALATGDADPDTPDLLSSEQPP